MKNQLIYFRFLLITFLTVTVTLIFIGCQRKPSGKIHPPKTSVCLQNLQIIKIAKYEWASEYNKTSTSVPTWDDLRPYMPAEFSNSIPRCQDGGTYTIGQIGEEPTCSIGGPGHRLSK